MKTQNMRECIKLSVFLSIFAAFVCFSFSLPTVASSPSGFSQSTSSAASNSGDGFVPSYFSASSRSTFAFGEVQKGGAFIDMEVANDLSNASLAHVARVYDAPVTVPYQLFDTLSRYDKTFTLNLRTALLHYMWTFDGNQIDRFVSVRTGIKTTSRFQDTIWKSYPDAFILEFEHEGNLPGPTGIDVYVGKDYQKGSYQLYYYNDSKNRIESVRSVWIEDGWAHFTINHCSTYFISAKSTVQNPGMGVSAPMAAGILGLLVLSIGISVKVYRKKLI